MILRGFDQSTMSRAFDWFLHDHKTLPSGARRNFKTREVSHSGKGNKPNLTETQIQQSEREFKNSMALLYLKTFYGKRPGDFKTEEYKKECERLNSYVSRSPDSLKAKIERYLSNNHVDYFSGELPQSLFYARLSDIGLSTDEGVVHDIFVTPKYVTQARIVVNPSQKDYAHLMIYLYEQAAAQELAIGTKTRLQDIKEDTLDNMVIYTSAKDFPKIVEILNSYGKKFPDKVAQFGGTIECLGRSEQDWFGFGFEPQRNEINPAGATTFNYFIDYLTNDYILPTIIFDDFGEITKEMSDSQIAEIFMQTCKDSKLAKEVALSFQNPEIRRQFFNGFYDLTKLREQSYRFTRENERLPEAERNGRSPEQLRYSSQITDLDLLRNENIPIHLKNGNFVAFSRYDIAEIVRSPILRAAMEKFYDTPAKVERKAEQMLRLWKYVGKNMSYLNETYPFLSNEMVREIEKASTIEAPSSTPATSKTPTENLTGYEKWLERQTTRKHMEEEMKEQEEIIVTLCGGRYTLASKLLEMGLAPEEINGKARDDLEKMFIMKVGLDDVIEASNYVKLLEDDKTNLNHRYENSLQALRHERGLALCDKLEVLPTKAERDNFVGKLSQHAKEDVVTASRLQENMSKLDDYIKTFI